MYLLGKWEFFQFTVSELLSQSEQQQPLWTKLWITYHCFDIKSYNHHIFQSSWTVFSIKLYHHWNTSCCLHFCCRACSKTFTSDCNLTHFATSTSKNHSKKQETAVIDMVVNNKIIKLREMWDSMLADNTTFGNVQSISITTIARAVKRHWNRMQLHTAPLKGTLNVLRSSDMFR